MPDNTLNARLIDWLNTQGYPLEMNVAEVLHKLKYNVLQSEYFIDQESGNNREIDIIASLHKEIGNTFIRISFIVECKVSREKPWIIFTSKNTSLAPPARVAQRAGSRKGKITLRNIAHKDEIQQLNLFSLPERSGYGLTQAFTSGNDVAYNSCVSVSKATRSITERYDEQKNEKFVNISFPVIVIDGKLIETYLDDNNEVCINEVNKGVLLWRNPIVGMPHTVITILTKDTLEEYFSSIRADVVKIFDYIAENPIVTSSDLQVTLRRR